MKFIKALFNRLRSTDAAIAESLKDPIADRKLAIEDAEKAIKGFREAIAESMSIVKSMNDKLTQKKSESEKYGKLAQIAIDNNNVTDAESLLRSQVSVDKDIKQLVLDIESETKLVERNKTLLTNETNKINSVKNQTDRLETRHKASETRNKLSKLRDSKVFDQLADFEEEIKEQEYYSESLDELNSDPIESIEQKYSTDDLEVQERLNKIKKPVAV